MYRCIIHVHRAVCSRTSFGNFLPLFLSPICLVCVCTLKFCEARYHPKNSDISMLNWELQVGFSNKLTFLLTSPPYLNTKAEALAYLLKFWLAGVHALIYSIAFLNKNSRHTYICKKMSQGKVLFRIVQDFGRSFPVKMELLVLNFCAVIFSTEITCSVYTCK